MGVVILGGLLTSTALNMLVVPALYPRFGSVRRLEAITGSSGPPRPRRTSRGERGREPVMRCLGVGAWTRSAST